MLPRLPPAAFEEKDVAFRSDPLDGGLCSLRRPGPSAVVPVIVSCLLLPLAAGGWLETTGRIPPDPESSLRDELDVLELVERDCAEPGICWEATLADMIFEIFDNGYETG